MCLLFSLWYCGLYTTIANRMLCQHHGCHFWPGGLFNIGAETMLDTTSLVSTYRGGFPNQQQSGLCSGVLRWTDGSQPASELSTSVTIAESRPCSTNQLDLN